MDSVSQIQPNPQGYPQRNIMQRMARWAQNPKHWRSLSWTAFRLLLLLGLSYIVISPMFFMITMSVRSPWDNMDPSVVWVPRNYSILPIQYAYQALNYIPSLIETLRANVLTGVIQMVSTCIIGYGFGRFRFKGREALFGLVLFTLIVPVQTIMPGLYMLMYNFKMIDTYWAFWLPAIFGGGLRSGIFVYIYRQFFRGQPKELSEAAIVDGCGYIGTFLRIMLPGATSIIITVFLFSLVWQWNDAYLAYFFLNNRRTLAVVLASFPVAIKDLLRGQSGAEEDAGPMSNPYTITSMLQAGCMLMIAPILLVYIVLQRYFTESISRSGIVG